MGIRRVDIQNMKYYRKMITHRAAVRALAKIAEVTLEYGTGGWYRSWMESNYDISIDSMVDKIKRYKHYHDKYFELKKVLGDLVND